MVVRTPGAAGSAAPPGHLVAPGPIRFPAFLGVVLASIGGPLALAAVLVPSMLTGVTRSAGPIAIVGTVFFLVPMTLWLSYSAQVAGPGGQYDYVRVAAGRRIAATQAALWIFSYVLYLAYTTESVVYDTLPAVFPGVGRYQPVLEVVLPVVMAAVMIAGRSVALAVIGVLAVAQVALVGVLAGVSLAHTGDLVGARASLPAGSVASAQVSLLYVCAGLPLFLGGEIARPRVTIRRGMLIGLGVTAVGVLACAIPLSADPAFADAPIPGMSMAQVFSGRALAVAVGVGVAVSTSTVILVEYLATSRLLHALTGRPIRRWLWWLAAPMVVAGPLSLLNPERFYDLLITPSMMALWLSQLIVFAVYPVFAFRRVRARLSAGRRRTAELAAHAGLAAGASAFAIYGLYTTLASAGGY